MEAAIAQCRRAIQIRPDDAATMTNLARLPATGPAASVKYGAEAVRMAECANQRAGGNEAAALNTLAAAYASAGRLPEAVSTARRVLQLATLQGIQGLASTVRAQLALYEANRPFRHPVAAGQPAGR